MQVCLVCGENFSHDLKFCPSCGADLKSSQSIQAEEKIENPIPVEEPVVKGKTKTKKKPEVISKSISTIKLIYFGLFLFLAGAVMVYSSGVFETPSVSAAEVDSSNPHSGVDLANLQEITRLEEVVKNNVNDFNSLLSLAHLLNDSGLKDKAIERYKEYLISNPNSPDVLVDLGVCYYESGKSEDAIKNMEKAVKLEPKHQIAHLNLGIVNFSVGNKEKAKEYWNKAISIDPTTEIAKRAQELINQH